MMQISNYTRYLPMKKLYNKYRLIRKYQLKTVIKPKKNINTLKE